MRFGKELIDRWGLLLAASSAGAAWAVQLPAFAAIGVGVVVLAARAGVASLSREPRKPLAAPLPDVDERSDEGRWLTRARAAAGGFESISESLVDGPLADRVGSMGGTVQETVTTLHRLAGRASTTGKALGRIDAAALAAERSRLKANLRTATDDVRLDLQQAMDAVQTQLDVHARLTGARTKLLAQLQSGALGLESLVARVVELSAVTDDAHVDTLAITELTDQLEGIRRGVVETEEATRRSLGG
ncbi:hypothetical protein SAMN05421504_1021204 [Amycolatopsis xylanica]|uniref:Uncharacterized protein n=1 Tax=Amycolatopsis xylanica TaxID=589385 RepID=A0A1H3B783_9PSEU|nr:hypothetical protein [Amycolatopsis xylanica]SDX37763.1 hypothetical protein SAMN05421504_1021204 [Amycolatopsis xylanica]